MKLKHEIEIMNIDPPPIADITEQLYFLLTLLQSVRAVKYNDITEKNEYEQLLNGHEEIMVKNKLFELIGRL